MVVAGCRWFYVVLGGFRSFHVLVTTPSLVNEPPRPPCRWVRFESRFSCFSLAIPVDISFIGNNLWGNCFRRFLNSSLWVFCSFGCLVFHVVHLTNKFLLWVYKLKVLFSSSFQRGSYSCGWNFRIFILIDLHNICLSLKVYITTMFLIKLVNWNDRMVIN